MLISDLDSKEKDNTVDILAWFNYLTFDVVSDLAFGEPLGMLDRGTDIIPSSSSASPSHSTATRTGVAAQIDYRGRTAAFLGLFPSILPPTWASKWIMWLLARGPDEFTSRGLRGTEVRS